MRIALLGILLLGACGDEATTDGQERAALPATAGAEAPTPQADVAAITELVTGSQRAGFERHDVEAYLAPWADDATLVLGRSAEPAPTDTTWDRAHLDASRRMRFAGPPPSDRRMRHDDLDVHVDGDSAILRCRTTTVTGDAEETVDEIFSLRRTDAGWEIVQNRSWPVRVVSGGEETVFDEAKWQALDAAVEGARSTDLVIRLLDAWRYREAYDAAARTTTARASARAHQMLASLAVLMGERDVAARAFWAAHAQDSGMDMPIWFGTD